MVINVTLIEAIYIASLVEADAKTTKEQKAPLLEKLNATIKYNELKQKKSNP